MNEGTTEENKRREKVRRGTDGTRQEASPDIRGKVGEGEADGKCRARWEESRKPGVWRL